MGAVNSACEGCFGKEKKPQGSQLNPKNGDDKYKFNELKQEKGQETTDFNKTDSLRSLNSNSTKKQNTSTTVRGSIKSRAGQESSQVKNKKLTIKDFDLIRVLGRGSFGKVFLVQKKTSRKYFALKTLKKEEILQRGHIDNALTEKNVLQKAQHPFVVRLRYSFQNETTLYLVMDFCPGGELFMQLKKKGRFGEDSVRFYAAETLLALHYLHEKLDIIYRDLKPENILLDASGHIKITDFGLSKATKKGFSFCGTPEYLAPEILLSNGTQAYDKTVDWWSLGCLIYEMLAGYPPFSNKVRKQLYTDILQTKYVMPTHFSEKAKDLLSKLLVKNPSKRLGFNGSDEIKAHPFFEDINWEEVELLKLKPPIVPTLTRPDDLRNFDRIYLNEPVVETPSNNPKILADPKNQFPSFTYVQKEIGNESYVDDSKVFLMKN